jgi:3-hydroxyisobutyrate dehydrogenase-like beta-hydroxyacid dehydrogenase
MKLALNTMIAVTNESISELLVLCERAGLRALLESPEVLVL